MGSVMATTVNCGDTECKPLINYEEPIALFIEHDAVFAGVLGALKAGKFYVPLDPSFPEERNQYMLNDTETRLIVVTNKTLALAQKLSEGRRQILNIDELDPLLPTENLNLAITPEQIAYLLYTSGSTGRPKGVMQNHRNILHVVLRHTNGLRIGSQDRLSFLSSYNVTASVSNMFGALLTRLIHKSFSKRRSAQKARMYVYHQSRNAHFACSRRLV